MAAKRLQSQVGQRFGRLVVIAEIRDGAPRLRCRFRCDCGVEFVKSHGDVSISARRGSSPCCAECWKRQRSENGKKNRTHGLSHLKLYGVHRQMLRRCQDPRCADYPGWGARGICVCDEWQSVAAFVAWALEHGYREGLTIERRDNNGHYEPSNCSWIPNVDQQRNRRPRRSRAA